MGDNSGFLGVGDRLKHAPAPELVQAAYALEAGDGPLLYTAMSFADLAHAIMLIEQRIIPPEIGPELLRALLDMHRIPAEQFPFDPSHGDAYSNREYHLLQRVPTVGGWLQTGRPRREVTTIAYLLVNRERILRLSETLLLLMQAILDRAEAHRSTIVPDYTYLQPAHPTTLSHYLLTFVWPMARDLDRLQQTFRRVNRSPAGSGSTNGSRLSLNREYLAELLGFDGLVMHTRDAMWQPDNTIEIMAAIVTMLINIDRLVEDLQIWATAEFDFVELADEYTRISVIMPQKKNPYSLGFVRGVARQMIGQLVGTIALQATPSGQVDNRIYAYGSVPRALEQARVAVSLLTGVIRGLTFNTQVMEQRANQGYAGATDLVDVIVQTRRWDTRLAHRVVGRAVRTASEQQVTLNAELLDSVALNIVGFPVSLTNEQITEIMRPQNIIQTRTGPGGASPQSVQNMIADLRQLYVTLNDWCQAQKLHVKTAEDRLIERAAELCQFI
ncbi:MAG: argininosuccinate lyase [Chloroflexi bacterium]|nr:argininosuccinate lyase [Chloroflexota bacterium]